MTQFEHGSLSEYNDAVENGFVPEHFIASGKAVAWKSSEYPSGIRHMYLDMRKGTLLEPEIPPPAPAPPKCTVDGVQVAELAILIKPVAFLVTTNNGVHELTRCYFQNGKFAFGVDMTRIGGIAVRAVEYFPERGLYLHLEKGYEVFAPSGHCQATWRLPDVV